MDTGISSTQGGVIEASLFDRKGALGASCPAGSRRTGATIRARLRRHYRPWLLYSSGNRARRTSPEFAVIPRPSIPGDMCLSRLVRTKA